MYEHTQPWTSSHSTDPCCLHWHPLPLHLPCRSASTWFGLQRPPAFTSISHISVCSHLNNLHSPVQLKVFELAAQDKQWRLLVSDRQIITAQIIPELCVVFYTKQSSWLLGYRKCPFHPFISLLMCMCGRKGTSFRNRRTSLKVLCFPGWDCCWECVSVILCVCVCVCARWRKPLYLMMPF